MDSIPNGSGSCRPDERCSISYKQAGVQELIPVKGLQSQPPAGQVCSTPNLGKYIPGFHKNLLQSNSMGP